MSEEQNIPQDKINYLIIEQSTERSIELIKQEYHLE
jgi:hypothetical protein